MVELYELKKLYPVTLYFHQEFTQGLLKGLDKEEELGFCTIADARHWVESVNKHNEEGRCDYKVTAFSIKW